MIAVMCVALFLVLLAQVVVAATPPWWANACGWRYRWIQVWSVVGVASLLAAAAASALLYVYKLLG